MKTAIDTWRNEYLANNLSFVEIDLLRGGRLPLGRRDADLGAYYVMVCRAWEFPEAGIWSFSIRDSLPKIPVPVTEELGDTPLDLEACVSRAFDEGRYAESLGYDELLTLRLRDEDRAWIQRIVSKRAYGN